MPARRKYTVFAQYHASALGRIPRAFSHRGFAPAGEENTVKAFIAATELGFGYLETDVHATLDGVLVAFHDEDLVRLTGDPRRVRDCTAAELAELRVAGESIPTFDELLERFPSARFNVDIKAGPAAELMAETLVRHRAADRVLLASFNGSRRRMVSRLLAAGQRTQQLATSPGIIGVGAAVLIGAVAPLPRAVYGSFAALQVPETHGKLRVVTPASSNAPTTPHYRSTCGSLMMRRRCTASWTWVLTAS